MHAGLARRHDPAGHQDTLERTALLLGKPVGDMCHLGQHGGGRRVASGYSTTATSTNPSFLNPSTDHLLGSLQAVQRPVQAQGRNCHDGGAMKKVAKCAECAVSDGTLTWTRLKASQ